MLLKLVVVLLHLRGQSGVIRLVGEELLVLVLHLLGKLLSSKERSHREPEKELPTLLFP